MCIKDISKRKEQGNRNKFKKHERKKKRKSASHEKQNCPDWFADGSLTIN